MLLLEGLADDYMKVVMVPWRADDAPSAAQAFAEGQILLDKTTSVGRLLGNKLMNLH